MLSLFWASIWSAYGSTFIRVQVGSIDLLSSLQYILQGDFYRYKNFPNISQSNVYLWIRNPKPELWRSICRHPRPQIFRNTDETRRERSYFINSARPPNQQPTNVRFVWINWMMGGRGRRALRAERRGETTTTRDSGETVTSIPLFTADGACKICLTGRDPKVQRGQII